LPKEILVRKSARHSCVNETAAAANRAFGSGRGAGQVPRTVPIGSSVDISWHLSNAMRPIVGVASVVRFASTNEMGIHLGRLSPAESQRLQDFLFPMVPAE
jgi:hypothetical protein